MEIEVGERLRLEDRLREIRGKMGVGNNGEEKEDRDEKEGIGRVKADVSNK